MKKSRLPYIDMVKLFAIICVVIGHMLQYNVDYGNNADGCQQDGLYLFIYSFHMQLFMLVSGIFFGSSLRLPFREIIIKKARQLLLPSYAWKLFFIILTTVVSCSLFGKIDIHISKDTLIRPYWFLTCVFLCYIICYVSLHLVKNKYLAGILTSLLLCIMPKTDFCYLNALLPFFWLGYWMKDTIITANRRQTLISLVISTLVFWILFPFFEFDMTMYKFSNSLISWRSLTLVSCNLIALMLFRFILALSASLMILSASKLLFENLRSKLLMEMGGGTIGIYLIHGWIIGQIQRIGLISIDSILIRDYIVIPLTAALIIIICHILQTTMKKNHYLNKIFFGA